MELPAAPEHPHGSAPENPPRYRSCCPQPKLLDSEGLIGAYLCFQQDLISCYNSLFLDLLFSKRSRASWRFARGHHHMELVVRKTDLLRELQLFQGIVERKNTIPILANVLLEADGTEVKLLATDLEVGLRSHCDATVSKPGIADAAGEEALRDRQGAARDRRPDRGRQGRRQGRGRSVRLADADAAARGLSDAARADRQRSARRCRATC